MTDTYSAIKAAMLNDVNRMTIISQNLANVSTPGYKKQIAINKSFTEHMEIVSTNGDSNLQTQYATPYMETHTDPSMGTVKYTGNPLDVVADGNTYFSLLTPNGIVYTKHGSFTQSPEGNVVNSLGYPLLAETGEILISDSNPKIDSSGNLYDGDKLAAKIKLTSFKPNTEFTGIGFGMYTTEDIHSVEQDAHVNIKQGYLEMSNVVLMDEMVKLIDTMRHFEASQKFMMGYDDMLDNAINIIGEV